MSSEFDYSSGSVGLQSHNSGGVSGQFLQGTMLQVGSQSCVVQRFLSAGGNANIYLVTLISDGSVHVLKHIPFANRSDDPEYRQRIQREINVMTQLSGHPHIVALEAAEISDSSAYILMEHCSGDVLALMNTRISTFLDEATILHIFSDACKGVAHMHYQQPPLLHRDLKVENILITSSGNYKLCDFGSATSNMISPDARIPREQIVQLEEDIQCMTTLEYRAPEMIDLYLRRGINEKADIWALGVLLHKLCYFKTPFDNASPLAILNAEYSIPSTPTYSKKLLHVIQMTLREEPRERPNIYTLSTYVCGLRGETCLLENKYASPPASPSEVPLVRAAGLGHVSAIKPVPQPRRYAATSSKYPNGNGSSLNGAGGDGFSDAESGAIVPMRRGRPGRQGMATSASFSASPGNSRTASPVPRGMMAFSSRFNSSISTTGLSPLETASKPGSASQRTNALGIYDPQTDSSSIVAQPVNTDPVVDSVSIEDAIYADDTASGELLSGSVRRMRMSVRAPDGRESISADFIQGAVFGSARRTSVLKRNPSVISNASSRRAQRGEYNGSDGTDDTLASPIIGGISRRGTSKSLSRKASMGSIADEWTAEKPGLPGFVCSPLPAPPPTKAGVAHASMEVQMASMISPLSMDNRSPMGAAAPVEQQGSGSDDPWTIPDVGSDSSHLRLSTILESYQGRGKAAGDEPSADSFANSARVQSTYKMTMDKLEDDADYSIDLDDPILFNAKARYAAQRSSVYQSSNNYYAADEKSMGEAAKNTWDDVTPDMMDSLMRKMDDFNSQSGYTGRSAMDSSNDPWSTAPPAPRCVSKVPVAAADIDQVLQRAEERNRKKLIAQNNRRSQYIFGSGSQVPEILKEDVEDNMRVLSEEEIESLLKKMDMYNRELLFEQEKWRENAIVCAEKEEEEEFELEKEGEDLERIIARANDELLRSEQVSSANGNGGGAAVTRVGGGLFRNVLSVAKSTFGKTSRNKISPPVSTVFETNTLIAESPKPIAASPKPVFKKIELVVETSKLTISTMVQAALPDEAPATKVTAPALPTITEPVVPVIALPPTVESMPNIPSGVAHAPESATTPASPPVKPPRTFIQPTVQPPAPLARDMPATVAVPGEPKLVEKPPTEPQLVVSVSQPTAEPISSDEAFPPSVSSLTSDAAVAVVIPQMSDPIVTPKLPSMNRMHSDTPVVVPPPVDPLAEIRMRMKKKQSSPMLRTREDISEEAAGKVGLLGMLSNNKSTNSLALSLDSASVTGRPVKSVRNLVAMFEKT
ncbi:Ark- serine/threonine protein kinase [Kickxella alabastrina]|uniref:Ark- serine/threonine protein kinase n=1 Tax=Kickxella alabastrina TaxID=61397 RepID=A0ACC1ITH1_9FUNG|nr:Ark- serine/threonine protein kinase [Kickxella alabastrina]